MIWIQRAAFEAVGDDVNATNIYDEMQGHKEWQIICKINLVQARHQKRIPRNRKRQGLAEHYRTNRNMIGDDSFMRSYR